MKNYQYLTDGLLESYLVGVVSDAEREQANQLMATDPELALQLEELELGMEHYFMQQAVPPPPGVKAALQQRLVGSEIQKWRPAKEEYVRREPPQPEPVRSPYVDVEVSDTHIRVHKWWRPAFVAVFVLSKIFLIAGLYFYFKANSLEQEVTRLKANSPTTQTAPRGPGE